MIASSINRQMFNPTVVKHNQYDGHIATAKQCGTHWIKYMLSHVLSQIHDLPPPEHVNDDKIVGHPKNPPIHDITPRLVTTHSHPHYTMRFDGLHKALKIPPCVFVVRNPKALLVSIYEKSKGDHIDGKYGHKNVSFAEFLRTDIASDYHLENIWGIMRFFNGWGAVQAACPQRVTRLHYEDLMKDTKVELKKLCAYFKIEGATPEIIETAVKRSSRSEMRKKLNTAEAQYERSINIKKRNFEDWYSKDDNAYFDKICARHLKYDFGYLIKHDT